MTEEELQTCVLFDITKKDLKGEKAMQSLYMVVCNQNHVRVGSKKFIDYDSAYDYAQSKNVNEGFFCLILELDNNSMKWKKLLTMYPR